MRLRLAALALLAACGDNIPPAPVPIDAPACLPEASCQALPCLTLSCSGDACACVLPVYGPDSLPVSVWCRAPR